MAPHRVAGAVTVSPYTYDARQAQAHVQVQSSSAAAATTAATAAAAATTVSDNGDHGSHAKGKKTKAKPRPERNPRQEEEMRFNTGPRNLRAPQANRGGRRGFRIPGRTYAEDRNGIPDYPPPSFQEAMTTPPVSVCSSTTSLPLAPPLPLVIPENIPEDPRESIDQPPAVQSIDEVHASDDDLDFEGTMFVIDRNSVPVCSTDLPRGAALEERVKSDWLKRRGVEFPGKASAVDVSSSSKPSDGINALSSPSRGRSKTKLLTPLLIDPEPRNDSIEPLSSPKRRFLSLSPLRTIFPPRSPTQADRATLSALPSPSSSPYPTSRSLFFRSSTSLATASFLKLPLLSSPHLGKRELLPRKFFKKDRGKQGSKDPETIDAWEVLTEETYPSVDEDGKECPEHPRSLLSAVESIQPHSNGDTSPTKSVSFMFGTPHIPEVSRISRPLVIPEPTEEERRTLGLPQPSQETFLRDWKGSSNLFLDRSLHRNRSPIPGVSEASGNHTAIAHRNPMSSASDSTLSLNTGPPLVSVRVRAVSPSPPPSLVLKHTAHVAHPSPLRLGANPNAIAEDQSAAEAAMYQRALDTPLPMTPIFYNQFDRGGSVAAFNSDEDSSDLPPSMPHSARTLPSSLTNAISAQHDRTAPGFATSVPATTLSIAVHPSAAMSMPTEVVKTNSVEEPMTPTRHHYAGRPLPRPPPSANSNTRVAVVDSMYASSEPLMQSGDGSFNTCPEGLLIDLEDTTLDTISASGATTPLSERYNSQAHLPLSQASSSSVDLLAPPPSSSLNFNSSSSPLPRPHSPGSATGHPAVQQSTALSDLTDLDLLVSRLADEDPNGTDYEVSPGHNGWNATGLNEPPDAPPSFRGHWARDYALDLDLEPEPEPEPQLPRRQHYIILAETQSRSPPQRQHLAHRAY